MPPVAFSSLCASREFLQTEAAQAFLRAFHNAKVWVQTTDPEEVAAKEASYFPEVVPAALAAAIRRYQAIGCWVGGVEIPRDLYQQAQNVFQWAGELSARYQYEEVCSAR